MGRWKAVIVMLAWVALPAGMHAQDQRAQLDTGIALVRSGDFEAAAEMLRPLTQAMEGIARLLKMQATAYLYLGIAELELEETDEALRAFWEAQRRDETLTLSPAEFSPLVLRTFEEARTYVPTTPEKPLLAPVAAAALPVVATEPPTWFTRNGERIQMRLIARLDDGGCDGVLDVDRTGQRLRWTPGAGQTCPAWDNPFSDVSSISATTDDAFVVQVPSAARPRMTFIPDLGAGGGGAATQVAIRTAVRTLEETVGKRSGSLDRTSLSGATIAASIKELMDSPGDYDARSIRTTGRLDVVSRDNGQYLLFADEFSVLIRPDGPATATRLKAEADRLKGQEVEVIGSFRRLTTQQRLRRGTPEYVISFWTYESTERRRREAASAPPLTMQGLTTANPLPAGTVRVVGKFRGSNIFGDLPAPSRLQKSDWVIKDDLYALWVTGKSPEGDGWKLDPTRERDSIHWVEVVGRVEERNDVVYLRADVVSLSAPPSGTSGVRTTARIQTRHLLPDVAFTFPVEGVEEAAPDAQFVIQFTKSMDPKSFAGRVRLRYADLPDSEKLFSEMRVTYVESRRVMQIDPGVALAPGRTIECLLLPGISDADGNSLGAVVPTPPGGTRLFRWQVEGDAN
jgi:hypothetical protein